MVTALAASVFLLIVNDLSKFEANIFGNIRDVIKFEGFCTMTGCKAIAKHSCFLQQKPSLK